MAMTAEDYRQQLSALLPQGIAWPRDPASTLQKLFGAFGAGFAAADLRADALLLEADPRTSSELLAEWELLTGLTGSCALLGDQTLQERRDAVAAQLGSTGGQSREYFAALALRLGFLVRIDEIRPFRMGLSRMGERYCSKEFSYVWWVYELERETPTIGGVGDVDQSRAAIECMFNRWKPAHTKVFFRFLDYLVTETGDLFITTEDGLMLAIAEEET